MGLQGGIYCISAAFMREVTYTLGKAPVYRTFNNEQTLKLTFTPEDNACVWPVGGSWSQERTHIDVRRTYKLPTEMFYQVVLLMQITKIDQLHRET